MTCLNTLNRPSEAPVAADLLTKEESNGDAAGSESTLATARSSHRRRLKSPVRMSNTKIQPATEQELNKVKSISSLSTSSTPAKKDKKSSSIHRKNEACLVRSTDTSQNPSSSRKNPLTRNNNRIKVKAQRNEPSGPKKLVSFKKLDLEGPAIRHIEPLKSLHKRDIGRRWVSSKEFRNIQIMASQHLDCRTPESADFSSRGLERLTEEGMNRFLQIRREALMAVLHQQRQCPAVAPQRAELIASAYRSESSDAQERAHHRGQLDSLAVQNDLKADRSALLETVRQEHRRSMMEQTNGESKRKGLLLQRLILSFRA